jgi:hypothetical protein
MIPVLYDMKHVRKSDKLEAVAAHPFCSEDCRKAYIGQIPRVVEVMMDKGDADPADYDGCRCENCGKHL